jgi:hypothetical protein
MLASNWVLGAPTPFATKSLHTCDGAAKHPDHTQSVQPRHHRLATCVRQRVQRLIVALHVPGRVGKVKQPSWLTILPIYSMKSNASMALRIRAIGKWSSSYWLLAQRNRVCFRKIKMSGGAVRPVTFGLIPQSERPFC